VLLVAPHLIAAGARRTVIGRGGPIGIVLAGWGVWLATVSLWAGIPPYAIAQKMWPLVGFARTRVTDLPFTLICVVLPARQSWRSGSAPCFGRPATQEPGPRC